jgi:hypothetical protein
VPRAGWGLEGGGVDAVAVGAKEDGVVLRSAVEVLDTGLYQQVGEVSGDAEGDVGSSRGNSSATGIFSASNRLRQ